MLLILLWTGMAAWLTARSLAHGLPIADEATHWLAFAAILPLVDSTARGLHRRAHLVALLLACGALWALHLGLTAVVRSILRLAIDTGPAAPHVFWIDGLLLLAFVGLACGWSGHGSAPTADPVPLHQVTAPSISYRESLVVEDEGGRRRLPADRIDFFEAEDNYVRIHTSGRSHLVRSTLTAISSTLDPTRFIRIHRRYVVNTSKVTALDPRRPSSVRLDDGRALPVGARYLSAIRRQLQL